MHASPETALRRARKPSRAPRASSLLLPRSSFRDARNMVGRSGALLVTIPRGKATVYAFCRSDGICLIMILVTPRPGPSCARTPRKSASAARSHFSRLLHPPPGPRFLVRAARRPPTRGGLAALPSSSSSAEVGQPEAIGRSVRTGERRTHTRTDGADGRTSEKERACPPESPCALRRHGLRSRLWRARCSCCTEGRYV